MANPLHKFYAKVTKCGNNYAVSSDELATALQDSASALMEGGNNLEQSVALIAAAMKIGCTYRNICFEHI